MMVSELLVVMDFDGLVLVRCNGQTVCGGRLISWECSAALYAKYGLL